MKTTRYFSGHLFRHDLRSNLLLTIVILLIMLMMANVINVAMSIMETDMADTAAPAMGLPGAMAGFSGGMDMTFLLNRMYFTVIGLLPLFLLIVLLANGLVAGQVDNGSMAYILSTPTKRSAVTLTHIVYLVLLPLVVIGIVMAMRLASNTVLRGDPNTAETAALYAGMYVLAEALAGVCFLGSCLFDRSRHSLAFGGGIAVWCFLASLLGMFGTDKLVNIGVGVEQLGIFNRLTLIGLYDIESLSTVGSGAVDTAFVWKLLVLAAVAVVCYTAGAVRFSRKDLPL